MFVLFFRHCSSPNLVRFSALCSRVRLVSGELRYTPTSYHFENVITVQYFIWLFCLLPLILPWSKMQLKWKGLACIILWIGAQTHWLLWDYLLEFRDKNVFIQLWVASLVLFSAANREKRWFWCHVDGDTRYLYRLWVDCILARRGF